MRVASSGCRSRIFGSVEQSPVVPGVFAECERELRPCDLDRRTCARQDELSVCEARFRRGDVDPRAKSGLVEGAHLIELLAVIPPPIPRQL